MSPEWLIFNIYVPDYFKIWCNRSERRLRLCGEEACGLAVGGENMNDSRIRTGIMAFPFWDVCHFMYLYHQKDLRD